MISSEFWKIAIVFYGAALVLLIVSSLVVSVMLNWILKEPLGKHLLSGIWITTIGFVIVKATSVLFPGKLSWINDHPQNVRTIIWDNGFLIATLIAFAVLIAWRLIIRKRGKS